jgi:hypothetical protein
MHKQYTVRVKCRVFKAKAGGACSYCCALRPLTINFLELHKAANVDRQTATVIGILLQHTATQ